MASEDSRLNQTAIIMYTLLCFSFQRQTLLIVCVESHDASLFFQKLQECVSISLLPSKSPLMSVKR